MKPASLRLLLFPCVLCLPRFTHAAEKPGNAPKGKAKRKGAK